MGHSHDRLVGASSFEIIHRSKTDAELAIVDGPHLILQTHPLEDAEAVEEFINRVVGARLRTMGSRYSRAPQHHRPATPSMGVPER